MHMVIFIIILILLNVSSNENSFPLADVTNMDSSHVNNNGECRTDYTIKNGNTCYKPCPQSDNPSTHVTNYTNNRTCYTCTNGKYANVQTSRCSL